MARPVEEPLALYCKLVLRDGLPLLQTWSTLQLASARSDEDRMILNPPMRGLSSQCAYSVLSPAIVMRKAQDRVCGALIGLACGDAVGATSEFQQRGLFPEVRDMVGGGPHDLEPGQWTDDTSMALCLAQSLIERSGHDPRDQLIKYMGWLDDGRLSSYGTCFDVGNTTSSALEKFRWVSLAPSREPCSFDFGRRLRPSTTQLLGRCLFRSLDPATAQNCSRTLSVCMFAGLGFETQSRVISQGLPLSSSRLNRQENDEAMLNPSPSPREPTKQPPNARNLLACSVGTIPPGGTPKGGWSSPPAHSPPGKIVGARQERRLNEIAS